MKNWIENIDNTQPLDLVIANAGVSKNISDELNRKQLRRIMDINMFGVLKTIDPVLPGTALP